MTEGYNPHILDTTRIWANSWEAVTSQQIARSWKSPGIFPGSTVAYLDRIYGKNIGNSAHDEEVADLFCLMKQLTLGEQAELFIDSDIASSTTNDF